ncbi:ferrous iron transport protein A [bacterium]|nr:ferrous iron transport protein A [bacterium]
MNQIEILSDLKTRSKGKVKKIMGQPQLKKKLIAMGIIPGSELEVLRVAPLGDPVEIRIKGYNLSLRKEEAKQVYVEVL